MSLAAKALLTPLLVVQALRTRATLPRLPEAVGERHGVCGQGAPFSLLIVGDSSAAGVGAVHQHDALAGRLVHELAAKSGRQVHWRLLAQSGLTTAQTLSLLEGSGELQDRSHYDLAVVVTGVNDLIDQVPSQRAVAARDAIANRLRNGLGVAHVVFAPLPPVHRFPGLPQPLRWVAGRDARRHDQALARWAATRGDVSRVEIELPLNPGLMAEDGFHPGPVVYRVCAHAIAAHIVGRGLLPAAAGSTERGPASVPRARPRRASSR